MSTPPVISNATGTCSEYSPECIGLTQKILFYVGLAFIAVGISGHSVCLVPFINEQREDDSEDTARKKLLQILSLFALVVVSITGGIALPYVKPWALRFGIPAICSLATTLVFLSGSCSYNYNRPIGSPLTTVFRVFIASASKIFQRLPDDVDQLYRRVGLNPQLPHTRGLRCLDKAAIILTTIPQKYQESNKWTLCSIDEVEQTKIGIRMVPMWTTFVILGIQLSIGNTYFLEQGNHMNRMVGHLEVPLPFFLLLYNLVKYLFAKLYTCLANLLENLNRKQHAPSIGIAMAMILSVLCCITAAIVETQRIDVIRSHDLLDEPDEEIPMTIFFILPQFLLLAAIYEIFTTCITAFFKDQAPIFMHKYLVFFTYGVLGLGNMATVLSVYLVGKVSESGGKPNWFQHTLNRSRLDKYYWTLATLNAVNLVFFILAASFYPYRES